MRQSRFGERCVPAVVVLLLTPVLLVFAVLLALGSGIDVFEYGERPLTLALCAPTVFMLLRYLAAYTRGTARKSPPAEFRLGQFPEMP